MHHRRRHQPTGCRRSPPRSGRRSTGSDRRTARGCTRLSTATFERQIQRGKESRPVAGSGGEAFVRGLRRMKHPPTGWLRGRLRVTPSQLGQTRWDGRRTSHPRSALRLRRGALGAGCGCRSPLVSAPSADTPDLPRPRRVSLRHWDPFRARSRSNAPCAGGVRERVEEIRVGGPGPLR
jgi:hypothetical protein